MQFEVLLEFCTIARTRSFSAAAEQVFVTEAALSRHIKKLEEEVGGALFYRTTRRVELTPLGKVFLPYAERGVDLRSEMDAALAEQLHAQKTQLTIACIEVVNSYIDLPQLLSRFNAAFPNILVNITTPSRPVADLFAQNVCELVFAPELSNFENSNFNRIFVRQDRINALVPKRHSLAVQKRLAPKDLENERLILISNGSPLFNLCMQMCQAHGFQPKVVLTMSSGSNIRSMVEQGMGIGLLLEYPSAHIHQDFPIGDKAVFLEFDPPVSVNFNLIYKSDLSPAGKAFLAFVRASLESGEYLI